MKLLVAIGLVIVSLVSAEPQNREYALRQTSAGTAPYPPSGWKPSGRSFNLPTRNQQTEEPSTSYGAPSTAYGPPEQEYGPPETEVTTTERSTTEAVTEETTLGPQFENIKVPSRSEKLKSAKIENLSQSRQDQVYVVVPQTQQLLYSAPVGVVNAALVERRTQKLVEIKEPRVAPVQAIPALAQIQAAQAPAVVAAKYEQYPQVVQFQQIQAAPFATYSGSLSQASFFSPFSSSFVQIYQ